MRPPEKTIITISILLADGNIIVTTLSCCKALFLLWPLSQMITPQHTRMGKRRNSVFYGLWFLLLALLLSAGRAVQVTKEVDEIDLDSLSDPELEEICTLRGFELVKEGVFSHDDYVEAARQCLAIERDM